MNNLISVFSVPSLCFSVFLCVTFYYTEKQRENTEVHRDVVTLI